MAVTESKLIAALVAAINSLVAVIFLTGTATFVELWLRQPSRTRIRLQSLFLLTGTVALVLAFAKWDRNLPEEIWNQVHNNAVYIRLYKSLWTLPLFVSFGCTVYMALLFATHLAGWCFRFVSRRFRRSPVV